MTDLLPCPFCGKPAKRVGTRWIECSNDGVCAGHGFICEPDAWNRRIPYLPPEDLECLRGVASAAERSYARMLRFIEMWGETPESTPAVETGPKEWAALLRAILARLEGKA